MGRRGELASVGVACAGDYGCVCAGGRGRSRARRRVVAARSRAACGRGAQAPFSARSSGAEPGFEYRGGQAK